jgi:RHS repeat-associated protein
VAIGAAWSAALAPAALAAARDEVGVVAPLAAKSTTLPTSKRVPLVSAVTSAPTPDRQHEENDQLLPELWSPRVATFMDDTPRASVTALFDGDAGTGRTLRAGERAVLRLDLGEARRVVAIGVAGRGEVSLSASSVGDDGKSRRIDGLGAVTASLTRGAWTTLSADAPASASELIIEWTAGRSDVEIGELALWVLGPASEALATGHVADRLVTEVPANARAASATPESASLASSSSRGAGSATFKVELDADPLLAGRMFLVYELEHLAQWTAPWRSINGHASRGGYRTGATATGGAVEVEEIAPAWLRRGDNEIAFRAGIGGANEPSYRISHLRIVAVPRGPERPIAATPGARSGALDDGDVETGFAGAVGQPATIAAPAAGQPAFLAFFLGKPAQGGLTVAARSPRGGHAGRARVDLRGRPTGWQTVPVGGALPETPELNVVFDGQHETEPSLTEVRLLSYPPFVPSDTLAVAYPLHGECFDHVAYVRGFVPAGAAPAGATLEVNGRVQPGALAPDGSFGAEVREPLSARGQSWKLDVRIAAPDGQRWTRAVSIDACLDPPRGQVAGRPAPVEDVGAPYGAVVTPRAGGTLALGGATLEIPPGAVDTTVRVTMRPLARAEIAPLDRLMTNVTPEGGAFRLGPHGLVFKKPVKLTLPIDPAAMTPGMTSGDVQAFFYDAPHGKWITVGRHGSTGRRVAALTGHFTDFVAATLALPDHPEAQLFNPNTMKDIKLGDPSTGLALIEPPQADPSGSAKLRYPIETPLGRNGVGPDLQLTYDSDRVNTNGWVGVGWDLSLSSVEIDTRFGVPKYTGDETYLLDGAMLTPSGLGDDTYIRRVEGRFDLIQRVGAGTADMHWEVTDKNGTKFTYGASANGRLADTRAVQPPSSVPRVFRWYLERVEDTFGNFMTVTYQHDPIPPLFDQLYPLEIAYTGAPGLAAAYHVTFTLEGGRPDPVITGRSGFPVETRRRLAQIDVKLGSQLIRSYALEYAPDSQDNFHKSVLSAVALRGAPGDANSELYRHTFDYAKAPPIDGMFGDEQEWGQFSQPDGTPRADDNLSHATDELFGASGSLGFGLDDLFNATISAGGDSGDTDPNLAFVDSNGDGLPDQLDRGASVSLDQLLGPATGTFALTPFPGLGSVGHSNRSGWTAGGHISAFDVLGAGVSYSRHSTEDDAVLADMEGDGFPDIVRIDASGVHVRRNTGLRSFAAAETTWGGRSLTGLQFTHPERSAQAKAQGAFFPADPLIRWVAPFTGTVKIDTSLHKAQAGGDGVAASLFFNTESAPRWTCSFAPNDLSTCAQTLTLPVTAGDRVYTKVTALEDPSFDDLVSSIKVTYQTVGAVTIDAAKLAEVEPYGAPAYQFVEEDDFRLAGLPEATWPVSADGELQIASCFDKIATTADNLSAAVVLRTNDHVDHEYLLDSISGAATGTFCVPGLDAPIDVKADQTVAFEIRSDAQIDPKAIAWNAGAAYQSYCRRDPTTGVPTCAAPVCAAGLCTIGPTDPLRKFPVPEGFTHGAAQVTFRTFQWLPATPTTSFQAPSGGTAHVQWSLNRLAPITQDRTVVLVQAVNRVVGKLVLTPGTNAGALDVSVPVSAGDRLFFTVFAASNPSGHIGGAPHVTIDGGATATPPVNFRFADPTLDNNTVTSLPPDPMSGGYHRWFYGDWNGSKPFNAAAIQPTATPDARDDFQFAMPSRLGLPQVRPDLPSTPMWVGRGAGTFMAGGLVCPGFSASSAASGNGSGVTALRVADTWNLELSADLGPINGAIGGGDSTTQIDLMDLNGDRAPDSVTYGAVQYNDPLAQTFLAQQQVPSMGYDDVRRTVNGALHFGVSINIGDDRGDRINQADSQTNSNKVVSTAAIGGSTDYGVSGTRVDFIDVNGDGLPDHVKQDPGGDLLVRLNLGYEFADEIPWSSPAWNTPTVPGHVLGLDVGDLTSVLAKMPGSPGRTDTLRLSDTETNSLTIGGGVGAFGAGGGPTFTLTRRLVDFIDINGDGLPDQLLRNPSDPTHGFWVKLNLGDRFAAPVKWDSPDWTNASLPSERLLGSPDSLGFTTLGGWSMSVHFQICFIFCVGGSAFYSRDNGGANSDFEDVDGDGKVDQVLKLDGNAAVFAKLNQTGQANLLTTVHRPLGGTIGLSYGRLGNNVALDATPKIDMPTNQWALTDVTVDDGQGSQPIVQAIDYTHANGAVVGFYDRDERETYGYADATTSFPNEGTSIQRAYQNQNYYEKELPTSTRWNQSGTGQTLKTETSTYVDPPASGLAVRTGTFFPAPESTETDWPEADPSRTKRDFEERRYDAQGNLTDVADWGDLDFADPAAFFNYHVDYVHPDGGVLTKANSIVARTGRGVIENDPPGALLRMRTATYFANGKPKTMTDAVAGGKDPTTGAPRTEAAPALATWTFGYDGFGNVATINDPKGHTLSYVYDPTTATYRTASNDLSFGYGSTADYDLRFGLPIKVVDIDGAKEETDYDDFGRVTQVFGPKDFASDGTRTTPSVTFAYSEQPHGPPFVEALPASAVTAHKNVAPTEMSRPGDAIPTRAPIRTATFIDGLARIIQTKKDITRDDGSGTTADGMSVSGKVTFDSRGRVYQQGQPTFQAGPDTTFVPGVALTNPTTFEYDVLSRERRTTRPDSSSVDAAAHGNAAVTTTSYQLSALDGKLFLLKLVQDPGGEVRSIYRSVRDEIVAVDEVNKIAGVDGVHLVTRYTYDPISQVLAVTDASGNETTSVYDTVGQTVSLTSPDAGRTEWRYDLSGNIAAKETANLRAAKQLIQYNYDFNRLEGITYPTSAPVTFVYGGPSETGPAHGFVAGRVKTRVDESGQVDLLYDGLGNTVQETSALVHDRPPQKGPYVNVMTYSWDSFGRMIDMKFPGAGAEVIRYGYDAGGLVTSARGLNTVQTKPAKPPETIYLQHVGYDEFGQKTRYVAGNGIPTTYTYEQDTRRLAQVNADFRDTRQVQMGIGPLPLQRLRYAYDIVGNVRTQQNAAPLTDSLNEQVRVGPTSFTYDYDRLHQLTHVDGLYQDKDVWRWRHSLDLAYDQIGNITSKDQKDFRDMRGSGGFQVDHQQFDTTYHLDYHYDGPRPHAVSRTDETAPPNTSATRTFSYDANGNQGGWHFPNNDNRTLTWNEEDRLRSVTDNGGHQAHYLYNAEGARTLNSTQQDETVYVNQYLTIRNGKYPTKHIYAGDMRIASKVDADTDSKPPTFWYHPDHLQSAQFVSTDGQDLVEHVEYFASGEVWQDEESNANLTEVRPDYKFNGKELDPTTGYYAFGERYYDPKVQGWLSPDPLLASYVRGKVNLGIFFPRNLGLYTYSWGNPVVLQDPNGAAVDDPWYKRGLKTAVGIAYGTVQALAPGGFAVDIVALPSDDSDFLAGKAAGEFATGAVEAFTGGVAVVGGGAGEVVTVGTGSAVALPVMAAGVYVAAQGAGNMTGAAQTLQMSRKAADAERARAAAANENRAPTAAETRAKNVDKGIPESQLGPSGEPKIHNIDLPSKKAAKEAAQQAGSGPPMHHPSPAKGKPHFHPTDRAGNKIPGPHFNYPKK